MIPDLNSAETFLQGNLSQVRFLDSGKGDTKRPFLLLYIIISVYNCGFKAKQVTTDVPDRTSVLIQLGCCLFHSQPLVSLLDRRNVAAGILLCVYFLSVSRGHPLS